jgi:hypothetical protein
LFSGDAQLKRDAHALDKQKSDRHRTRPLLHPHAETAKEWGAVNEIVPAEGLAKLPPLTASYTRIALTQKLHRIIDEGVGYGLTFEVISAADVARARPK